MRAILREKESGREIKKMILSMHCVRARVEERQKVREGDRDSPSGLSLSTQGALLVADSIILLSLNGSLLCKEKTDPNSAQWRNFTSRKLSRERERFCERVLRERERVCVFACV